MSKQAKLKFQLTSAILCLVILLISGFFIFGPSLSQVARAVLPLNGDYDRNTSGDDQVDMVAWDYLDEDFVDQNGDTMTGALTVPDLTVTGTCTGCGAIEDESGNSLRMVCGETLPNAWVDYGSSNREVYTDINISTAGFTSDPYIITSIHGRNIWRTYGASSVYQQDLTTPLSDGFRIYIYNLAVNMDSNDANTWNWTINWCAIGN